MVFAPTPPRSTAPSQLLPLTLILAPTGGSTGDTGLSGSIVLISPPSTGTSGTALPVAGTVSPAGTAVRVGLSSSATSAPGSWASASVSGTGWTASLTPSSAGTYYIWAQQTATPTVLAVSAAVAVSASLTASVTLTSPPTSGTAGTALSLAGIVSPSGTAVQVGLSTSATVAPTSWMNAMVSGTGWTASLTPSSAGSYYVWAEQTSNTDVQAISAAVTVAASGGGGSALTYSLISGSGSGAMTSVTMTNATSTPPVGWTSSIAHGATNVQPNAKLSSTSGIASGVFWFDTSATNVTPPGSGFGYVASLNNAEATFYANNAGFGTPTCAPAAPATAGTYYGKYAFYSGGSLDASTGGTLLGVYVTSAITIT